MGSSENEQHPTTVGETDRRVAVLESALVTFARFGYRKTSMEEVARQARISRPGLYFMFTSKQTLFRAAVTQALQRDLAEVERVLAGTERALRERVLEAFGRWAGSYVGPLSRDITAVVEDNPELLGSIVDTSRRRFEELVTDAISVEMDRRASTRIATTLISTSIGIKLQVDTRDAYFERLEVAIDLLLP